MPVTYTVVDGLLVVTATGEYPPEELRRVRAAGLADPATPKPARVLLDVTGAASVRSRSSQELRASAGYFASFEDGIERVAVLATDDLGYGLMRMASTFSEHQGLETAVFRTFEEARDWLRRA